MIGLLSYLSPRISDRAPFSRLKLTADTAVLIYLAGLSAPVLYVFFLLGIPFLYVCFVSLVTVMGWNILFAVLRRRPVGLFGLVTALVFASIVRDTVPFWQISLSLSFGVVLGEQIFGGRGFGFLNPVIVALAFLVFSFPGVVFAESAPHLAFMTLPALFFLLLSRLVSWRLLFAMTAVLLASNMATSQGFFSIFLENDQFLFVIVFLACDPASSSATNTGRWLNGILTGLLIVLFSFIDSSDSSLVPLVQAIMLASLFAPLIDTLVTLANIAARRRRDA